MATYTTYEALGQAEDFQDDIYIISPIDNPVVSMSRTLRATGKLHEYQEDALRSAKKNANVEGADAPAAQHDPTTDLAVNLQIFTEVAEISGTVETVDKYGRDSEMAYELEKKYGALANDEELAVVGAPGGTRQTGSAGTSSTARELTSIHNQFDASVIVDATLYTTVAQLEDGMVAAHVASYNAGGNPTYVTTNPDNSLYISAFAYATGRQRDIRNETELVNVVELYKSQVGELDVVLDRHQDACFLGIDFNYTATPVLRPTYDYPLATNGDAIRRQVIRESSFALLNTKSGFMVDNIPTGLT